MRFKLFIPFVLIAKFSFSQQSLTNEQINRVADAGKVWGYMKYFHPYLQYKNISWDSAFAAIIPDILAAKNKGEYEKSLEKLFSVLNDPVTAVIHMSQPTTAIKYSDLVIEDSVMIITRDDYRAIVDEDTIHKIFIKAISQLEKARTVIFDLRPDKETFLLNEAPLQEIFEEQQILSNFFKGIVPLPAIRTVIHKAFITESPESNSVYQSLFLIERQNTLVGKGERNIPIIFIINKYSELPIEAVALQLAGKAAVIQEEGGGEIGIVPDVKFFITDHVLVRTRLGEFINSNNGLGFYSNLIIPESENRNIAIAKAKELLHAGIKPYQTPERNFNGFTSNNNNKKLTENSYPSVGERVLAAAKIYTVLKYFYPNKYLWTHDWDSIYLHFLPRFVLAGDSIEYVKTVMEMYANIQDGHGFMTHPLVFSILTSPGGIGAPFQVRTIENQLVITRIFDDSLAAVLDIKRGDIILEKDGINVLKDIDEKRKYWSASNYEAQTYYITLYYLRNTIGKNTNLKLKDSSGKIKNIQLPHFRMSNEKRQRANDFIQRGNDKPMMYFITKDIGYVNLGVLRTIHVDSMFNMFRNTKAIIFDIRNNARSTSHLITPRLSEKNKQRGGGKKDLPGWDLVDSIETKRKGWIYKGKTIGLIAESTQSHGEATTENLKAANATLIGNHTAGANGDIRSFFVPGNIRLTFSGYGSAMQGKGIQPDILVKPTIKGIQQGRDEILERAVKFLETGK